jgi:hypothetical protein
MSCQDCLSGLCVTLHCELKKFLMFDRGCIAKYHGNHQIPNVLVENRRVRVEKNARATSRKQRLMELGVVSLQYLQSAAISCQSPPLHRRQLVMSRDDTPFPQGHPPGGAARLRAAAT